MTPQERIAFQKHMDEFNGQYKRATMPITDKQMLRIYLWVMFWGTVIAVGIWWLTAAMKIGR